MATFAAPTMTRLNDNQMTSVKTSNDDAASGNGSGGRLLGCDALLERPASQRPYRDVAQ